MCKNVHTNNGNFHVTSETIKKDESKCFLSNKKVTCLEKHPNKPLCLFHDTIFDIWNIYGGHKILKDTTLSDSEKYQIFLRDFNEMDFLTHDTKFTDETIGMIESYFESKFKKK